MRRFLPILLIPAGIAGSSYLHAQDVSGVPLPRTQRTVNPTVITPPPPADSTPAQINPNQRGDMRPPGAAPRANAVAGSQFEIKVSWTPVPEAIGYLVRRNPETAPVLLTRAPIEATELVDNGLLPNTRISYDVWADFGPKSPNSPGRSGVVTAATLPLVNPSGFTASCSPAGGLYSPGPPYTIYLRWDPAPGATYYSVKSAGLLVYKGPAPQVTLTQVPEGEHDYELVAFYGAAGAAVGDTNAPAHVWGNAYNLGGLQASVTSQPSNPNTPFLVNLSWYPVPSATGYTVGRKTVNPQTGAFENQVLLSYDIPQTRFTDAGRSFVQAQPFSKGATYRYYVAARYPYHGGPAHGMGGAIRVTLPQ